MANTLSDVALQVRRRSLDKMKLLFIMCRIISLKSLLKHSGLYVGGWNGTLALFYYPFHTVSSYYSGTRASVPVLRLGKKPQVV